MKLSTQEIDVTLPEEAWNKLTEIAYAKHVEVTKLIAQILMWYLEKIAASED